MALGDVAVGSHVAAEAPATRRLWIRDLGAVASYVVLAFWVTWRIWLHPSWGLAANRADQAFFEWMLGHGALVATGQTAPFFSEQMNVPLGINLMANTSVLGISLPLAPVTLLLGPHVAFNVFLTGALILTAVSWYLLLSRYLLHNRLAAWIGAGFCAFAPGMISQANGHPNLVAQFLVPVLIWRTLELRRGPWLRNGVLLGLVVVWQAFINLEILFMTAVGLVLFVVVAGALRWRSALGCWRPFVGGGLVAVGVAAAALWYPIGLLLFGPQSYSGLPYEVRGYGADLGAYVALSRESLLGSMESARGLAQNAAEENSFFGWPLVVLVLLVVIALRRSAAVLGLFVVGVLFAYLSLGPVVRLHGSPTGLPSLWSSLHDVPVLSSAVPTRWALAVTPVVGLLLAYGVAAASRVSSAPFRAFAAVFVAVALVPIAPTALPATKLSNTPSFVSSGTWADFASGGRSIVFVPMPTSGVNDPIRWSAMTMTRMPLAGGYFLAPVGPDRIASFTSEFRPTNYYLRYVSRTGRIPPVSPETRTNALADLSYWNAGAVVIPKRRDSSLWIKTMTALYGVPPQQVGDVWLWDAAALRR
ncbi:hypothetical protein O7635_09210 [Asanoa sp. WMMD1127]|uniref:hypothetical protein n=1 Tax=Asanoa sp. WMMD1127 TaxID=3016107 RepID=UPI00241751F4|nr:hypothetical protein [Asanoa sp. WMMD1127]MDG4822030.1 hypothetical protein [Asanoa sp. WMMD1127]